MSQTDHWQQNVDNMLAQSKALATRIEVEIEFARNLAELENKPTWNKLADKAQQVISEATAGGKLSSIQKAVTAAEEILAPLAKTAKKYTIHCIGHAHIDMNWMWSWPETVALTNDTFTTVLRLMDEFPEFHFSQSQASVYEILREYCPEILEKVKQRVAEGRWEVNAVHWVEGDKNLASGESLCRHLLYTRNYIKDLLGLSPEDVPLDWEPDTFGHAHTIPSIDSRGGVKYYFHCRTGQGQRPPVFWWKGPDGAKLLVYRHSFSYNGTMDTYQARDLVTFCRQTHLRDWLCSYGVGDHGGGPTRRDMLRLREYNTWPIFPNFRGSTARKYFELLEANGDKWPTVDSEMNFEFTGCYTTQTSIKKANRYGENMCLEAELAATMANKALARAYPAAQLREAWINVLFGHFHDIIPGSGVRATREYQMGLFQKTSAAAGMIKTHSLRALAGQVDTTFAGVPKLPKVSPALESTAMGGGMGRGVEFGGLSTAAHVHDGPRPFVIFNPVDAARNETVTLTVWDANTGVNTGDLREKEFVAKLPDGTAVPAQRVGTGDYWAHQFVELAVPVKVAPLGYTSVVVEEAKFDGEFKGTVRGDEGLYSQWGERIRAPGRPIVMENEHLLAEFDVITGGIKRLVDKATGVDVAKGCEPMGMLEYVLERPRIMTAWVIGDAQETIRPIEATSVQMISWGPHQVCLEVKCRVKQSTATLQYILRAGQPWLEIAADIDWHELGGPSIGTPSLRMVFPLAMTEAAGRYEIPFGSIERDVPPGQEVPSLRWANVNGKVEGSQKAAGFTLLNDCKYGHALKGSMLSLTLLRSSYDPDPIPEVGRYTMRMGLVPHGAKVAVGDLVRMGSAFNQVLQVVPTEIHKGDLPAEATGASCDKPNVLITSIKKALDDSGLIIGLVETAGQAVTANVTLEAALFGSIAGAAEVDILERPIAPSGTHASGNGFSVRLPAHGIARVKLT